MNEHLIALAFNIAIDIEKLDGPTLDDWTKRRGLRNRLMPLLNEMTEQKFTAYVDLLEEL